MKDGTPLTELEQSIARKIAGASLPPYSASKRFGRDLGSGYIKQLSSRGRAFMAFVAHRFRRQYVLTEDEIRWVNEWIHYEESKPAPVVKPEIVAPQTEQAQRDIQFA